jgi:hypothetical protein
LLAPYQPQQSSILVEVFADLSDPAMLTDIDSDRFQNHHRD